MVKWNYTKRYKKSQNILWQVAAMYLVRNLKTVRFSDVFSGYRKGALGTNGLTKKSLTENFIFE